MLTVIYTALTNKSTCYYNNMIFYDLYKTRRILVPINFSIIVVKWVKDILFQKQRINLIPCCWKMNTRTPSSMRQVNWSSCLFWSYCLLLCNNFTLCCVVYIHCKTINTRKDSMKIRILKLFLYASFENRAVVSLLVCFNCSNLFWKLWHTLSASESNFNFCIA